MIYYTNRTVLGESLQTPFYRHDEHVLGYETDIIFQMEFLLKMYNLLKEQAQEKQYRS